METRSSEVFGRTKVANGNKKFGSIRKDEGCERKQEVRADLFSERRIKLRFQGVGGRLWILERRNGLARGLYNRLVAADRFPGG